MMSMQVHIITVASALGIAAAPFMRHIVLGKCGNLNGSASNSSNTVSSLRRLLSA